ncbi:MAG: Flp pilus assembly complex ATPase component TadA [Gemmatimonadaceae bacterium]|nr:Flp pilus assembly complex ATPase component TadA [Gemmatimonadaceae bacterium]
MDPRAKRRDTIQALRDAGFDLFDPEQEDRLYPEGTTASQVETLPMLTPREVERGKPAEIRPAALVPDRDDNLAYLAMPGEGEHRTLRTLLAQMQHFGANDLHLMIGEPPAFRLDGQIRRLDHEPLAWEHMRTYVYAVVTEDDLKRLDARAHQYSTETGHRESTVVPEIDVTYSYAGTSYRCNVALEAMGISLSMRRIPSQPPSLKDLRMPKAIDVACTEPSGLILIAGPTGAGKTTTMAAVIDRIARQRAEKIITIEDPIEFVYQRRSFPAFISQRQVGRDTHSFASGIKAALRQDPDIIVVGELLDVDATALALQAAQTGHLVFATIHAGSAAEVPSRVVDFFPADQRATVAAQLASVLRLFTFQQILPKIGGGLIPAFAVTAVTPAIRKNIDGEDKIALVNSCRQSAKEHGGCTLADSVEFLIDKDIVETRHALLVLSPEEREDLTQRLRT